MMMGYGFGSPWGVVGMGISFIVHALFLFLLILAAIWLFRQVFRKDGDGEATALEILKRRYAGGEIDQAEYERMKLVLRNPE